MREVFRTNATVPPDGKLIVEVPRQLAGMKLEVVVLAADQNQVRFNSIQEIMGAGQGRYKDVAEIDTYINELRDEWER
jgi:hypothetical protein